jgi:hypothetical protein
MEVRVQTGAQEAANDIAIERQVFLIGRPPFEEYLDYMTGQTIDGQTADVSALAAEWRTANDHIQQLEQFEAGLANGVTLSPIPDSLGPLQDLVLADPIFRRSYGLVPSEIAMVELDRLVVYQKRINLDHVERLKAQLAADHSPEAIFKFCLPSDHPQPPVKAMRTAQNAFTFVSPSNDLRVLEAIRFAADQIVKYSAAGPIASVIGVVVGFGSNFLNALYSDGRLVLNNGSHRAYALRELGITQAPCIIQRVSRREELPVLISGEVAQRPELFFAAARPPLLKDYFDPHLRKIVRTPRSLRQVRVTFAVESMDVPAA